MRYRQFYRLFLDFMPENYENIQKQKHSKKRRKRQESKHTSMRKTLYKRYLMLNLAEIEQKYTANFVCKFLKIS